MEFFCYRNIILSSLIISSNNRDLLTLEIMVIRLKQVLYLIFSFIRIIYKYFVYQIMQRISM